MKKREKFVIIMVAFSLLFISMVFYFYQAAYGANILIGDNKEAKVVYIGKTLDFKTLREYLEKENIVHNVMSFAFMAQFMGYQENIKPGKYKLTPGMSNVEAIRLLRSGNQEPVNLTFNNARLIEDLPAKLAVGVMADSATLHEMMIDTKVQEGYGFTEQTFISMFVPNTYQVFWTYEEKDVLDRIKTEYDRFWNEERKAKAAELNMTPVEVSTLASIVQKETNQPSERPRVAGLYLNRLRKKMLLQADPTVVFATGEFDLKRVLNKHLEIDSPYNTYKNIGLPPGPICMPEISSIDAVLNSEDHEYIFMCSKGDESGLHNFAKTNRQHNVNRQIYERNLRERGKR